MIAAILVCGSFARAETFPQLPPPSFDPAIQLTFGPDRYRIPSLNPNWVRVSPDGQQFLIGTQKPDCIQVLKASSGEVIDRLPFYACSFDLSPDGAFIAGQQIASTVDGRHVLAGIWKRYSRELSWKDPANRPWLFARFSRDGKMLAILSACKETEPKSFPLQVIDTATGKILWHADLPCNGPSVTPRGMEVIGDDLLAVHVSRSGGPRLFRMSLGKPVEIPDDSPFRRLGDDHTLASSSNPRFLLTNDNFSFDVWTVEKNNRVERLFGETVKDMTAEDAWRSGSISPDGQWAVLSTMNTTRIYHIPDGKLMQENPHGSERTAFTADGKSLVMVYQSDVSVFSSESWALVAPMNPNVHFNPITQLRWSPDGNILASLDRDTILVWDANTRNIRTRIAKPNPERKFGTLTFHPTEPLLYAGDGAEVWWWDYSQITGASAETNSAFSEAPRKRVMHVVNPPPRITDYQIALDQTGRTLLVTWNAHASLLDLGPNLREKPVRIRTLNFDGWPTGKSIVTTTLWPNGRRITAATPASLRTYELDPDRFICEVDGTGMIFSPDSRRCAGIEEKSGDIRIQDVESGPNRVVLSVPSTRPPVRPVALAWSSDGALVAASLADPAGEWSGFGVWDVRSKKMLKMQQTLRGRSQALAFRPGKQQLAYANADGTVDIWELASPE